MSKYGKRDWAEVEAHPLPAPLPAMLEDLDDAAHFALRRHIVEQAWEIERLTDGLRLLSEAHEWDESVSGNFASELLTGKRAEEI